MEMEMEGTKEKERRTDGEGKELPGGHLLAFLLAWAVNPRSLSLSLSIPCYHSSLMLGHDEIIRQSATLPLPDSILLPRNILLLPSSHYQS